MLLLLEKDVLAGCVLDSVMGNMRTHHTSGSTANTFHAGIITAGGRIFPTSCQFYGDGSHTQGPFTFCH